MKAAKKFLPVCLFFIAVSLTLGCKEASGKELYKVPQKDRAYYMGLRRLSEGNKYEARRLFSQSAKKSSNYIARRSAVKLTEIGNVRERLEACDNLLKKYNDEDALLISVKQYSDAEEWTRVIVLTNNVDYETSLNQLCYYRLNAMQNNNNTRLYKDACQWFSARTMTGEHYKLYCDLSKREDFAENAEVAAVLEFRAAVYKKKYAAAYDLMQNNRDLIPVVPQLVSDMGKVCVYGNSSYLKNAQYFDSVAKQVKGTETEFYVQFYAGRLYEKLNDYSTSASNRFKAAMEASANDKQYDNALWYLLDLNMKKSTGQGIKMIKKYCSTWHDPAYFDDIFDTLSPLMLSEGRWNDFADLYKAVDGYASDAMTAKYAYIHGRLVQEKLALPNMTDTHKSEDDASFSRALVSGNDAYYRVMAVNQLGLAGEQAEEVLCNTRVDSETAIDIEAENLLLGYISFGFPEKIYPEWMAFSKAGCRIGYDTGIKLTRFLEKCGRDKNEYYPQTLRIAAKVIANSNKPVPKEDFKLLYPRDYPEIVSEKCAKYQVPEEIMYALVRSESFFDAKIESVAGAVGLTQLMTFTGSDIAHRLKYKDYDLKNPDDNLEFGTWYLANLAGRLENRWLPAFFSYNAGITRVRRWQNSSKIEFNNMKNLPDDLFLETIPYAETREYGRKLVGAAAMYAWLYYDKEISQEVSEIVK